MFPAFLLTDEERKRIKQREAERKRQWMELFEAEFVPNATDFSLDYKFTPHDRHHRTVCFRAETFQPVRLFDIKPVPPAFTRLPTDIVREHRRPNGYTSNWLYRNSIWPRGERMGFRLRNFAGEVCFTADVVVPVLFDDAFNELKPWMSLTPQEMISMRGGVRLATGDVLIGGLGLGYLAGLVAEKRTVRRVVVVERSEELAKWIGPVIAKAHPKVEIKVGDIWDEVDRNHQKYTRILLDIWDKYGNNNEDPNVQRRSSILDVGKKTWIWAGHAVAPKKDRYDFW